MSWNYKATWPVKKGDEITSAHFEDLRKIMWSIDWILDPTKSSDTTEHVPEWDYWAEYAVGDRVMYEGKQYELLDDSGTYWDPPPDTNSHWQLYVATTWEAEKEYHRWDTVIYRGYQYT